MKLDFSEYGEAFAAVLPADRLAKLGPGEPVRVLEGELKRLPETAFEGQKIVDQSMADACVSGAWLFNDFLETSHTISQGIETPTGSYWHAIMHRREPDASNAKYWFRRVGDHPVYPTLAVQAGELIRSVGEEAGKAAALLSASEWDPDRFVDLCEQVRGRGGAAERLCEQIQRLEWEILFDFSYAHATGSRS